MADDIEEISAAAVAAHQKHQRKLYTEAEYRRKHFKLLGYTPEAKQILIHNSHKRLVASIAANRVGKTTASTVQAAIDATGTYDDHTWYRGPRIAPASDVVRIWCASTSSSMTRDNLQAHLLGDLNLGISALGTGWLPLEYIEGKLLYNRGLSMFVDSCPVRREGGGSALIQFKSFEQKREAFQGLAVHRVLLDEDPGHGEAANILGEVLARLTTTRGRLFFSATALYGVTPVVKYFQEQIAQGGDAEIIKISLFDAPHVSPEEREIAIKNCPPHEYACRILGEIQRGEGLVFPFAENEITHNRHYREFKDLPGRSFKWAWALDFAHASGSATAHPFAAVLLVYEPETDTIYAVEEYRKRGAFPVDHCAWIRRHECGSARVLWPPDGGRNDIGGEQFQALYKKNGLNMAPQECISNADFNASIIDMGQRLRSGRLKIGLMCPLLLEEIRGYHWKDNQIVPIDDDLVSACRIGCWGIKGARILEDRVGPYDRIGDGPLHPWHEPIRSERDDLDAAFWRDFHGGH